MPEDSAISITDMTQLAYDCVRQESLSEWTYQKYWYNGVVPIRRYFKEQKIIAYSPESTCDCVDWFRRQLETGLVKEEKFRKVRKIAQIMEKLHNGEAYQWNYATPATFYLCLRHIAHILTNIRNFLKARVAKKALSEAKSL